jgi:RNA recognition motif-containing protein
MNIYVGNLPFSMTEEQLREMFESFGEIASVNIIKDKYSGESKGFGFVEMSDQDAGNSAIQGLNDHEVDGRRIKVSEAHPRKERGGRGGPRGRQRY